MAIGHSDQNVERLLETAYQPEVPDPDFVQRVEKCLLETAQQLAEARATTLSLEEKRLLHVRRRLSWIMGTAAAVAGIALVWHAATYKPGAAPFATRAKFVEPDPY